VHEGGQREQAVAQGGRRAAWRHALDELLRRLEQRREGGEHLQT